MLAQDPGGVVFHALDSQTGRGVAVRRFFPFGPDGGGLSEEEQAAYNIALSRLAGLEHPALRSVVAGGCDPVDGMPFIATDWVEGVPLPEATGGATLSPPEARALLTAAMEVSAVLSEVLAEEAVWVETSLETIIVDASDARRGYTFWISPFKWLGSRENRQGLEALVALAEQVLGWQGRVVGDQAGQGLGSWVKWMRASAATASLQEAMEMLAACTGGEPPAPTEQLVAQATRGMPVQIKQSSTRTPLILALGAAVVVLTAGVWAWQWKRAYNDHAKQFAATDSTLLAPKEGAPPAPTDAQPAETSTEAAPPSTQNPNPEEAAVTQHSNATAPPPAPVPPPTPAPPPTSPQDAAAAASARAAELQRQLAAETEATDAAIRQQREQAEARGHLLPTDRELLLESKNQQVTVQATCQSVSRSNSGATLYLMFGEPAGRNETRAAILRSNLGNITENFIESYAGKNLRVTGTVRHQTFDGLDRIEIHLASPDGIEVVGSAN